MLAACKALAVVRKRSWDCEQPTACLLYNENMGDKSRVESHVLPTHSSKCATYLSMFGCCPQGTDPFRTWPI